MENSAFGAGSWDIGAGSWAMCHALIRDVASATVCSDNARQQATGGSFPVRHRL